ncbi:MAG TPA: hypothetical protein VFE78_16670 [Gemmataceae bacterium]|jgi:hypothetical protein|nr:hypothetical protein [Gemmataceae bacterium]
MSRAASAALVLLALTGAARSDEPAAGPSFEQADRGSEYRRMVRRYEALSPCRQHDDGPRLRQRFCAVLKDLLRDDLAPGASREEIRRCLGEPVFDWGNRLLYHAERDNWFYALQLKDGKLQKCVRVGLSDQSFR